MNQTTIGSYIAQKRRAKNLTQEQLAEKLGVSNKTISTWENGLSLNEEYFYNNSSSRLRNTLLKIISE